MEVSMNSEVQIEKLIKKAIEAYHKAYAPYSQFSVGCAIEMENGNIYTGFNIENMSYGGTMCAERVTLYHALASGEERKTVRRIVITGKYEEALPPCALCRQVMLELCSNECEVIMTNIDGKRIDTTVGALVPYAFGGDV